MDIARLVASIIVEYGSESKNSMKAIRNDMLITKDTSTKLVGALAEFQKKLDKIDGKKLKNLAVVASKLRKVTGETEKTTKATEDSIKTRRKASTAHERFFKDITQTTRGVDKLKNAHLRYNAVSSKGSKILGKAGRRQQGFTQGIQKTSGSLTNYIAKFRVATGLISFALTPLKMVASAYLKLSTAMVGASAGIFGFTVRLTGMTKEITGTARALNVSVGGLRAWKSIVEEAGVSADAGMDTMEEFRTSLRDALQTPKNDIRSAFEEAGISAEELQAILASEGTEKAFFTLIQRMQDTGRQSNELALRMGQIGDRLLKGEGQKIITFLTTMKKDVIDLKEARKELNLQDADSIEGAKKFQSEWTKVKLLMSTGAQQIAGTIGSILSPVFGDFIEGIQLDSPKFMQGLRVFGEELTILLGKGALLALDMLDTVKAFAKALTGSGEGDTLISDLATIAGLLSTVSKELTAMFDGFAVFGDLYRGLTGDKKSGELFGRTLAEMVSFDAEADGSYATLQKSASLPFTGVYSLASKLGFGVADSPLDRKSEQAQALLRMQQERARHLMAERSSSSKSSRDLMTESVKTASTHHSSSTQNIGIRADTVIYPVTDIQDAQAHAQQNLEDASALGY